MIHFEKPGLQIIRFTSTIAKQQVKVDRLRLVRDDNATPTQAVAPVTNEIAAPSTPKVSGAASKITYKSSAAWSQARPGFEWAFPFIDRNRDGKIDAREYKTLQQFKEKHGKAWRTQARKELDAIN